MSARKRPAWDPIGDPARSAELREYWTERAAIGEYERGMTRREAERAADELTTGLAARLRAHGQ